MNTKTIFTIKHFALLALFAVGLMLVPNAGTALAQKGLNKEVATQSMLSYALNLKSVANVAVYGENVSDKTDSTITNGYRAAGADRNSVSRKDLSDVFSAISQLPCTEIADSELGGKTFGPGVYCLGSADLTSRLVLDAGNDAAGTFVFRTSGAFNAKNGSMISLENGAIAGNVYFVSEDTATVGEGVDFKGNVIARNGIGVGANTMVDGRVLSVKGEVAAGSNSILGPQQLGTLEICKAVDPSNGDLSNRIFRFAVAGLVAEAPAGGCSGVLTVPTGTNVITELQDGRFIDTNLPVTGNFQLTSVTPLGQTPASAITSTNLPAFQATVNVTPAGGIATQTRVLFTNRFAIVGLLEICKEGLDSGVTGFFNFRINELVDGTGTPFVFAVPVGQCTGAIAVLVPTTANSGPPRTGTVTVVEEARTGFLFTSATTATGTVAPTTRLQGFVVCGNTVIAGVCPSAALNGGGSATVTVVAGTDGGITGTGGTAVQTTVFFNNRTAPGQLKICKIAGPGIPINTAFTFSVAGTGPLAAVPAGTTATVTNTGTNPAGAGGVAQGGSTLNGGQANNVASVTVLAGPVVGTGAALAGSGFCNIVPGSFIVDSTATITETGPLFVNDGGLTREVRVSRVTSSSGIVTASQASTGPALIVPGSTANNNPGTSPFTFTGAGNFAPGVSSFPANTGAAASRTVTVPIVRQTTEVEFVNVGFAPAPLKVCKVAGTGVAVGTPFTFTTTTDGAGLQLNSTSTRTILAGPASTGIGSQNGNCDFVAGPFTGTNGAIINGNGSFNVGSTATVTESTTGLPAGSTVAISSPTGPLSSTGAFGGSISILNQINEIVFVNSVVTPPVPGAQPIIKSRKRARFF
jgi:hypothetical protein